MNDDLFSGTRTPRPPADLRERALRAARAAARERVPSRINWWGLGAFDIYWAGALLVLLACNVLLSLSDRPSAVTPAGSQAIAEERQLEKELGLKGVPLVVAGRDTGRNGDVQKQLMQELERL